MLRTRPEIDPVSSGAPNRSGSVDVCLVNMPFVALERPSLALGILKAAASYLFELFGPVSVKRGDICSGAGEEAQLRDFGVSESHDIFDVLNSRLIVLLPDAIPPVSPTAYTPLPQ